jgi:hypothetical protein
MKILSPINPFQGRDSDLKPVEYKAGVPTTRPQFQCSIFVTFKICCSESTLFVRSMQ